MAELPFDLLFIICRLAGGDTTTKCLMVCKMWNEQLKQAPAIWKALYMREIRSSMKNIEDSGYMEAYLRARAGFAGLLKGKVVFTPIYPLRYPGRYSEITARGGIVRSNENPAVVYNVIETRDKYGSFDYEDVAQSEHVDLNTMKRSELCTDDIHLYPCGDYYIILHRLSFHNVSPNWLKWRFVHKSKINPNVIRNMAKFASGDYESDVLPTLSANETLTACFTTGLNVTDYINVESYVNQDGSSRIAVVRVPLSLSEGNMFLKIFDLAHMDQNNHCNPSFTWERDVDQKEQIFPTVYWKNYFVFASQCGKRVTYYVLDTSTTTVHYLCKNATSFAGSFDGRVAILEKDGVSIYSIETREVIERVPLELPNECESFYYIPGFVGISSRNKLDLYPLLSSGKKEKVSITLPRLPSCVWSIDNSATKFLIEVGGLYLFDYTQTTVDNIPIYLGAEGGKWEKVDIPHSQLNNYLIRFLHIGNPKLKVISRTVATSKNYVFRAFMSSSFEGLIFNGAEELASYEIPLVIPSKIDETEIKAVNKKIKFILTVYDHSEQPIKIVPWPKNIPFPNLNKKSSKTWPALWSSCGLLNLD